VLLPTYKEKDNLPLIIWLLVKTFTEECVARGANQPLCLAHAQRAHAARGAARQGSRTAARWAPATAGATACRTRRLSRTLAARSEFARLVCRGGPMAGARAHHAADSQTLSARTSRRRCQQQQVGAVVATRAVLTRACTTASAAACDRQEH